MKKNSCSDGIYDINAPGIRRCATELFIMSLEHTIPKCCSIQKRPSNVLVFSRHPVERERYPTVEE